MAIISFKEITNLTQMKIVFCTLAINNWYRQIVHYSIESMGKYCKMHGYEFVIGSETSDFYKDTNPPRAPCWYKIKIIQVALNLHPECDFVFWLDADCQILKHDLKLEHFIAQYFTTNDTHLVVTQDSNTLNTGVMFLRNSPIVRTLLDKVWTTPVADYFEEFHEQTVLANIYNSEHEYFQNVIKILPYGKKDPLVVYWGNYFPGKSFLIHCARCSNDPVAFMYMMDLFYPFKLKEETNEQHRGRMTWIRDTKICRQDIDAWQAGLKFERTYSARCIKEFPFLKDL